MHPARRRVVDATESAFERNISRANARVGIVDVSQGGGTGGTANTYTRNSCSANGAAASTPAGLCG